MRDSKLNLIKGDNEIKTCEYKGGRKKNIAI